ncbi:MAG: CpaF family protein, partial [Rhodospirillaceae bacterium]|nr:CpaF family protein [Rhodospirillaceae bacterium]
MNRPFGQRRIETPVEQPAPPPAAHPAPPPLDHAAIEAKLSPPPVPPRAAPVAEAASRDMIRDEILASIEPELAVKLNRDALVERVAAAVSEVATEHRLVLNEAEQRRLAQEMVDDMVGLGPLEPLLHDETISDILVNGARQVYVERRGKLELTSVRFRSEAHVMHVIHRIASKVRRSINESSPMLDARLDDGSRVNAIIWPLALRGPNLSIRKFSKRFFGLDEFVNKGSLSPSMAKALKIAAHCRLNILISGGTGSGKT